MRVFMFLAISTLLGLAAVPLEAQSNPLAARDTALATASIIVPSTDVDRQVEVCYLAGDTLDATAVYLGSSSVLATTGRQLTVGTCTPLLYLSRKSALYAITGAAGDTVVVRILGQNRPTTPSAF